MKKIVKLIAALWAGLLAITAECDHTQCGGAVDVHVKSGPAEGGLKRP